MSIYVFCFNFYQIMWVIFTRLKLWIAVAIHKSRWRNFNCITFRVDAWSWWSSQRDIFMQGGIIVGSASDMQAQYPANMRNCPGLGLMLAHRPRRWPNINPTPGQTLSHVCRAVTSANVLYLLCRATLYAGMRDSSLIMVMLEHKGHEKFT